MPSQKPARSSDVFSRLQAYAEAHPDLRPGQIWENIFDTHSVDWDDIHWCLFHLEADWSILQINIQEKIDELGTVPCPACGEDGPCEEDCLDD